MAVNGHQCENQREEIVNRYKEVASMLNDILNECFDELLSLDLTLEDPDFGCIDDKTPTQTIMKVAILIDFANEVVDIFPSLWGGQISVCTCDLFPDYIISPIVGFIEPPLLDFDLHHEVNDFFGDIVQQMEDAT